MVEMQDLSGPYRPEFKLSDLSKEALIRLIRAHQKIYVGLMVQAGKILGEQVGEEKAAELSHVLYDRQVTEVEIPLIREAANIPGNDVVSMYKYFQVCTDGQGDDTYKLDVKVTNDYDVSYTGKFCVNAAYYEARNDKKGLDRLCAMGPGSSEHEAFRAICRNFHPKMKMAYPLLPPRASKDAPFCKWRFWVEEEDRNAVYDRPGDRPSDARAAFWKPGDDVGGQNSK